MDRPPDSPVVFLDACALYPSLVREVILRMANAGLLRPAWSPRVLAEWHIAATRNGDPGAGKAVDTIVTRMAATFPDASVTPDPEVEQTLDLPDPADIHVLAGAIAAGAGVLVTFNMRDFPVRRLAAHGVAPRHPDGFLWEMFSHRPEAASKAIRDTAARTDLTEPDAIRRALKRARLPRLAKAWFAKETPWDARSARLFP